MTFAYKRQEPSLTAVFFATAAVVWTLLFIRIVWRDPSSFDFGSFYRSGQAWNSGLSAYRDARPNLNPPWFTAVVLSPLSRLPIHAALAVWLVASAVAVFRSLVIVKRELSLTGLQLTWVFIALAFSYAWTLGWWQAQIGWILMYLVTRAWSADRHRREFVAGCWLGLAVAIKPTLALAALPLGWRPFSVTAVASLAITVTGTAFTGLQPWKEWLDAGASVNWYSHSPNASIPGVLMRLRGVGGREFMGLSILPATWLGVWLMCSVVILVVLIRQRGTDRSWALGLLTSILISPLGWLYYLPLALGPIVASVGRFSKSVTIAVLMLAFELPLLPVAGNTGADFVVAASLGCAGTLMLWLAVVRSPPSGISP